MKKTFISSLLICILCIDYSSAQILYQAEFPKEEFQERRDKVFNAIGDKAIALLQGAPSVQGFYVFRQTNNFYYLCGLEVPHSYLLLDGAPCNKAMALSPMALNTLSRRS